MTKKRITRIPRFLTYTDNRGQNYIVSPDGQMRRKSSDGSPLPRVKMSKKARLKLRREYNDVKGMKPKEIADKISAVPVINPLSAKAGESAPEERGD